MNFFAHSVVAAWADPSAPHLLGSMLPDFETIVGQRLLAAANPVVQRGVDFHHRSDEVFHCAPPFVALCRDALRELTQLGVRRGSARAVAHVGAEMFLDGLLARDSAHAQAYLTALQTEQAHELEWPDQGTAFSKLCGRLQAWGPPTDYSECAFVLTRLERTLAARPKLRILDEQRAAVSEFLPALRDEVEHRAAELLQRVRLGLALQD